MKNTVLSLVLFFVAFTVYAQDGVELDDIDTGIDQSKIGQVLDMFSFSLTAGSGSLNNNKASNLALGELNISYKLADRITLGLSTMGNLSGCPTGYTNSEGQYVSLDDDEDGDMGMDDEDDSDEDDDEDCDVDEVSNLMATGSYHLSEKIPVYIQLSAGYSFDSQSPAISTFVGYSQNIFRDFGVVGGIRLSNVFIKAPADALNFSTYNLRAELGLNWNF